MKTENKNQEEKFEKIRDEITDFVDNFKEDLRPIKKTFFLSINNSIY